MNKLALRGSEIQVGDILKDMWFFPKGEGEVISLSPYIGPMLYFAGEGSQVATIRGTARKLTLPAVNWYIVYRDTKA